MITDYLFLGPRREVLCNPREIRRYVEEHYGECQPCPRCGCYLVPTDETQRLFFRVYRCANCICSASVRVLRSWPRWAQKTKCWPAAS